MEAGKRKPGRSIDKKPPNLWEIDRRKSKELSLSRRKNLLVGA